MIEATCPGCGKIWKLPDPGRKYTCRACGAQVGASVSAEPSPPEAAASAPAAPGDPALAEAPPAPSRAGPVKRKSQVHEFRLKYAQSEHKARSRAAARWMFWLGLVFIVAGAFAGFTAKRDADKAIAVLEAHPEDTVQIPGRAAPSKVTDLIEEVRSEARQVWVINGVLAAAFLGLAFWARKAPVPAAVTGLCLYLVIQVFNLIADPSTLVKGLAMKVLFIIAMVKTISSALAERALMRTARPEPAREADPEPAPAP